MNTVREMSGKCQGILKPDAMNPVETNTACMFQIYHRNILCGLRLKLFSVFFKRLSKMRNTILSLIIEIWKTSNFRNSDGWLDVYLVAVFYMGPRHLSSHVSVQWKMGVVCTVLGDSVKSFSPNIMILYDINPSWALHILVIIG